MGKWKYINWLMVLIILAHMYYYLATRYEAHMIVYVLATAGWLTVAIVGYYIYVYRINRPTAQHRKPVEETTLPGSPAKERPKVAFKKKNQP